VNSLQIFKKLNKVSKIKVKAHEFKGMFDSVVLLFGQAIYLLYLIDLNESFLIYPRV